MQKTRIDWADYTVNPVKGYCPMACEYCYARRIYDRFGWDKTIRSDSKPLSDIRKINKPSRIFVGSTIELFGEWVDPEWLEAIFSAVEQFPQHTFIFLTKQPQNLRQFNPWPKNAWVGVTATNDFSMWQALSYLSDVNAPIRYISVEPLLERIAIAPSDLVDIDWLIIGSLTGPGAKQPAREWIGYLMACAYKAQVPVFLKRNLQWPMVKEEFPKGN